MKGDFSQWGLIPGDNFSGVLHQQGRVSLDQDWNAATQITQHWRARMGEDAIGAGVVAVPAATPNSLKVTQATATASGVQVTLQTGRVWNDGVHLYYNGTTPLTATYLMPPLQNPQATVGTIAAGVRDAVILEVWDEAFSAFQDPRKLLEPALGGPDTTERVQTSMALKLLRLGADDDCGNLKLADNFYAKGKLTVTATAVVLADPCPVRESGGYSGFEHYLYRVEIAEPQGGPGGAVRFKWSQFNGGLVGRGSFSRTGVTDTGAVAITANGQMIDQCGLPSFYLEALAFDAVLGHWRVVFTADATPLAPGTLALTNADGPWPDSAFFRLWNGIAPITAFPPGLALANELKDGIRLVFEPALAGNGNYTPGDYWTFPVRTAGVDFDPTVWPTNAPPQGVRYRRAPLAIITWSAAPTVTVTAAAGQIHDCRRVFQPLTKLQTCCTLKVGDGLTSFGDYDSIQAAINALPANGGEICVLPGVYIDNVKIRDRRNVTIRGCGERSRIQSKPSADTAAEPVISIAQSENIRIEGLAILAHSNGIGIHVEGGTATSQQLVFHELILNAATRSALQIDDGRFVTISQCRVRMNETPGPWPGVFVIAEDALIERNTIFVQRESSNGAGSPGGYTGGGAGSATGNGATGTAADLPGPARVGRGGLQLGALCRRVRVLDNLIQGGIGNGITLGTIRSFSTDGTYNNMPWVIHIFDPCSPCEPGDIAVPLDDDITGGSRPRYESAGPLYDITVERNRIYDMGLNGIGVAGFFNLAGTDEFITIVRLNIIGNDIRRCLRRTLAPIPATMIDAMGYGGIALADVEYLVIRDNLVEANGRDHRQPICGVFVLHAEGVEIVRNRILHNGMRLKASDSGMAAGRRGGINIVFGIANTVPVRIGDGTFPRQDGVPAIKIHDNIVSHPLGQALALTALGPVSVVGNQFTSQGVIYTGPTSPSFLAGCVQIVNLFWSYELLGQLFLFRHALNGSILSGLMRPILTDDAVVVPRGRLDDQQGGRYLANGNVLFSNNQCLLDLSESGVSLSLSSIMILSFDDVGFHGNQCDCNLFDDFITQQVVVLGLSVRVADNRFKESWHVASTMANAWYSAVTFGVMNATTNNQSTHCLLIGGHPALRVDAGNRVLRVAAGRDCDPRNDPVVAAGGVQLRAFR